MRSVMLFITGVLVGAAIHTAVAQDRSAQPAVRLNHVAISVPDVGQAMSYYGDRLGFREVARNTNQAGQLVAAYIQVSRDTFIELQQANAQRPKNQPSSLLHLNQGHQISAVVAQYSPKTYSVSLNDGT